MSSDAARHLAPAVARSIRILDVLEEARGRGLSLTEVAAAIDAAKSSTSNLCTVLEESGLIQRRPGGAYTLGRRTVELGGSYIDSFDQLREFHRLCEASEHLSQQLVKVAMLDGTEVLYLARHEGRTPFQFAATVGARFPAASTAVGNALLSGLDDEEVERRFVDPASLPRWTDRSVVDVDTLLRRVRLARERGWADDAGAVLPGMQGYAVTLPPVRLQELPLALGVSFVASETPEDLRAVLLEELAVLRDELVAPFVAMRPGGPGPDHPPRLPPAGAAQGTTAV